MADAGITLKSVRSNLPRHAATHSLSVGEGKQLLSDGMPKTGSQSEALKRAGIEEKLPLKEDDQDATQKKTYEVPFWQA